LINSSLLDEKLTDGKHMPPECFDDMDFDDRPLEVWAELVHTKLVTARAMRPGAPIKSRWQPCRVTSFDHKTSKFVVVFEDSCELESVSRLFICFDAEDPMQYIDRLLAAVDRRKKLQTSTLLSLYADN